MSAGQQKVSVMNMNQIVNMVLRTIMHRLVNTGINAGINAASNIGKPKHRHGAGRDDLADHDVPDAQQKAKMSPQDRARIRAMRQARRAARQNQL